MPRHSAAVKCAPPDKKYARRDMKREYEAYRVHKIASNPSFRQFYEIIGDPGDLDDDTGGTTPCLALQWLDTTFADVPVPLKLDMRSHILIKDIIETLMLSFVSLGQAKAINTDTKPANVLLSGIDTNHVIVKVAELGSVFAEGLVYECQPYAFRAPEVYQGQSFVQRSHVWACAAMVLWSIKPSVIGLMGNPGSITREGWCIAKLKRLFPGWTNPPVAGHIRQLEFKLARRFLEDVKLETSLVPSINKSTLGHVFNRATGKLIPVKLARAGPGFWGPTDARSQVSKDIALEQTKEAFEAGNVFKEADLKNIESLSI
ncbi:MAG: hypothetical protein LQ338_007476, partial [Usnochroma carphineum]